MAADPIIYCLEHLTDYDQFERLCHDVMALSGYTDIEPLGGHKDKGRDALHVNHALGRETTVFAYSVRDDWRKKLAEDCAKVQRHGHPCNRFVFLCTATFTPSERDNAVDSVKATYGWDLDLFGLERLRVLLNLHQDVIAHHPQIFCPPFFSQAGGVSLAPCRDYLVLDFHDADEALGTWLSRRLLLAGYFVWCRTLAPIAGTSLADTLESLIRQRAFRFLPILSPASLQDPDLAARRALALREPVGLLLPLVTATLDTALLDNKTKNIEPVSFATSWAKGLAALLDVLAAANCPRNPQGSDAIALRSFIPEDVVAPEPETLYSNRFPVLHYPQVIHRFRFERPLPADQFDAIRYTWAFRKVDPQRFLAFHPAPAALAQELGISAAGGAAWECVPDIDGVPTRNLGPELIRKSLEVESVTRGLLFCPDRKLLYFPSDLLSSDRQYFLKPDGSKSFIAVAGRRKFYRPGRETYYRYHLAPQLAVGYRPGGTLALTIRNRIRLTDDAGTPLQGRTVNSRRKHLCKSWWNDEWFSRVLAVVRFLGDGTRIVVGPNEECAIVVDVRPDQWEVPLRINEEAIRNADANRDDALTYGRDDEDDDE